MWKSEAGRVSVQGGISRGAAAGHGEISRGIGRAFFLFVLRDREKEGIKQGEYGREKRIIIKRIIDKKKKKKKCIERSQ